MREERGVFVAALADALEPCGERCVEASAARLRQAGIGHFAGQCVLEREFAFAGECRAGAATNEVAVFERPPLDVGRPGQLGDRAGPEDAPDHGRRLERRLRRRIEQVDPRSEHRLHGIGNGEVIGRVEHDPSAVSALHQAAVDQRCKQLLEVERVSLGALEHQAAKLHRQVRVEQLFQHLLSVSCRERLDP